MNWRNAQSGTNATDHYREGRGLGAAQVLLAGSSTWVKSGDHSGGSELCTEAIVRLSGDPTKRFTDNGKLISSAASAVHNLNAGNGFHKNQASHSGGNTCAEVIAAATN